MQQKGNRIGYAERGEFLLVADDDNGDTQQQQQQDIVTYNRDGRFRDYAVGVVATEW